MVDLKGFKFSKKLFMALVTVLIIILNEGFNLGIDEEAVFSIAGIAATYIFGQAVVDRKLIDNGVKRK